MPDYTLKMPFGLHKKHMHGHWRHIGDIAKELDHIAQDIRKEYGKKQDEDAGHIERMKQAAQDAHDLAESVKALSERIRAEYNDS